MKLAALDLGSNSIHMVIADVRPAEGTFQVIDREKDMVKLGAGCFEGGRLTEAAIASGMRSLRKCAKLIERHGCEEVIATATSAVREAKNGGKFLRDVTRQTGIVVRVISGEEEARLIYLAARSVIDLAARRALILDIGGGSVEAIVGDAQGLVLAKVLKLGVLRLRDRFAKKGGPLERRDRKKLEEAIAEVATPVLKKARAAGFELGIGTSGTILALAAGSRALAGKPVLDAMSLTNERLQRADLERLVDWLCQQPEAERGKLAGVDPSRADTIHLGGVLLLELMKIAGLREIVLCSRALREGLILDYIERTSAQARLTGEVPDIRRRSLLDLVRRCETSGRLLPHGKHVAVLALQLFDQLGPLHGMGPVERQLLEFAALVHDVGESIAFERHERHSHYLVKNAELRGFTRDEVDMIAMIARYHRGGLPKKKHPEYARLGKRERVIVKRLAAILRVADGLDRSHFQVVRGVRASVEKKKVVLAVDTAEDAELEVFTARRKGGLFERALGRALEVRSNQQLDAIVPATAHGGEAGGPQNGASGVPAGHGLAGWGSSPASADVTTRRHAAP